MPRSMTAYARITDVQLNSAIEIPGVRAIISGKDFDKTFGVLPISEDEPPLAVDKVRYIGEPVLAIAAETISNLKALSNPKEISYELASKTNLSEE